MLAQCVQVRQDLVDDAGVLQEDVCDNRFLKGERDFERGHRDLAEKEGSATAHGVWLTSLTHRVEVC